MIICETQFDHPDPDNPDYSLAEVDFYACVPFDKFPQHRLSLRKNLKTGQYEVIRVYSERQVVAKNGILVDTGLETGDVEVVFSSPRLSEALNAAKTEYKRFWDDDINDEVCRHKPPKVSFSCKIYYKR